MAITVQDTYLTDYATMFPGMLLTGNTQSRPTGINADATATPFGAAVFSTGTGKQVTKTPGTKFKGIVIADLGVVPGPGGTPDAHGQYGTMSLCDMGDIGVVAGSNTTKDAPAFVTAAGVFTAVSTGNTAIPATFISAVTSGSPVGLRVVQQ